MTDNTIKSIMLKRLRLPQKVAKATQWFMLMTSNHDSLRTKKTFHGLYNSVYGISKRYQKQGNVIIFLMINLNFYETLGNGFYLFNF